MHRHAAAIGIFMLIMFAAVGCGRQKQEVIARVDQHPITQRELWESLEQAEYGEAGRRGLDALIVRQLVRHEARKRNIEVTRDELQSRIDALKDYRLAYSGKPWEAWLADTGQAEEDVARSLSLQMLIAKLILTEEDRERYFEEHKDEIVELPHNNESVIYRQIVVASKEEAEAIHRELTADESGEEGADFAEIAEARSLDPVSRPRGGMMGWAIKGKSGEPELEQVLFSLGEGEIGEPMPFLVPMPPDAEEGEAEEAEQAPPELWRIVKVERHVPPHEITLADNADVIEESMLNEADHQLQLHQFFVDLRERADIEIVAPRYRALGDAYRRGREARERRLAAPPLATPVAPAPLGVSPQPAAQGEPAPPTGE